MPFMITCDQKGCNKLNEARLDVSNNQVICGECGGPIANVSPFTKNQMKASGQIIKNEVKQKPYAVKCDNCGTTDTPKIKNKKVVCMKCEMESKISKPFEKLLRDHLREVK